MTENEMVTSLREKVFDLSTNSPILSDATYERVLKDAMYIHFTGTYDDLNNVPDADFPVMLLLAASMAATIHSAQQSSISNSTNANDENQTRVSVNLGGALSVSETDKVNSSTSATSGSRPVTNWKNVAEFYKKLYDAATLITTGSPAALPYIEQGYLSRTSKITGKTNRAQWMRSPPVPVLSTVDVSASEVLLSWSFPVNAALEQAACFQIWYGTNVSVKQGFQSKFTLGTVTHKQGFTTYALETRNAKITGLTTGNTYYFKLFVFNQDSNQKPSESNELTVVTL